MIVSTIIYSFAFAISLVLCYIYEKKVDKAECKNRLLWMILIIAPVVILAGLRYGIGIDYFEYEENFYQNKFEKGFSYFIKEPLNFLIMQISHFIFPNSVVIFFVYSLITMVVLFLAIEYYKHRMSVTFALFIFYMTYYLVSYNIIRQMIAVMIIFYGIRYIFEKKFLNFFVCVVLAGMIHKTAYLMIIVYFFCDENLGFLHKIKLFEKPKISENTQSIIIYIVIGVLPFLLIPFIPKVISVLGIYKTYLTKQTALNLNFLLYVLPILTLILVFRREILNENKQNEFFIRMIILQIPFQFMGGMIKYIDRFALYPAIMQIILIPILVRNLRASKMHKLIKFSIIGWYIFYFVVMFVILNSNGVMPYQTIFCNRSEI